MQLNRRLVALAILASAASAARSQSAHFTGLGDLPGGATISYAYGISGSGEVIAGESFSSTSMVHGEGVHWRRVAPDSWEMTGIGYPTADALNTPAAGASGDGEWIVGRTSYAPPTAPALDTDAYRWSPDTGFQLLPVPAGFVLAASLGADKHGHTIVGFGGPNPNYTSTRALAWQRRGSSWQVEMVEPTYDSQAARVEAVGKIIVGWGSSPAAAPGREAVYWTRRPHSWERHWLGALPSTVFASQALGLARVKPHHLIVGFSGDFFDVVLPTLWKVKGNDLLLTTQLPLLPGTTSGSANAISEDGSRIVGNCWDADFVFRACIWDWDPALGAYVASDLQVRLNDLGVTAADGWSLWSVAGVSADGTEICGSGSNPFFEDEAWVAELP
jgi:uncharacterized membrane protein